MSLDYPHSATITRAREPSGSTDAYGQPTSTLADTTVHSGKADFQHGMSRFERSQFGDADLDADGMLFFPESVDMSQFQRGDNASITGVTSGALAGAVKAVDYMDVALAIKLEGT